MSPPWIEGGNKQCRGEVAKLGHERLRHTSHTLVLDCGRTTDWQHSEWKEKLLSQLEWWLLSQEW